MKILSYHQTYLHLSFLLNPYITTPTLYRELCESYNIKNPYKKRFEKAVKNLQKSNSKFQPEKSSQIRTVVMTIKESDAIKSLQEKLDKIDIMIENNSKQTTEILNKTKLSENEIESKFILFESKLKERKKVLNIQLHEQSNKALNKLKQEQDTLNNYKTTIQNAQKKQQSFLMDDKLDATKREFKMEEVSKNILENINISNDNSNLSNEFVVFTVNSANVTQVV